MESGLDGRNNFLTIVPDQSLISLVVSMESGLDGRNNLEGAVAGVEEGKKSQWSPA
mgnify:CR=1 FL=1